MATIIFNSDTVKAIEPREGVQYGASFNVRSNSWTVTLHRRTHTGRWSLKPVVQEVYPTLEAIAEAYPFFTVFLNK